LARPRWGSSQRSPDPIAEFKAPTSKGREGRTGGRDGEWTVGGKGRGERRGGKRGEFRRREREGRVASS